jgi:hypothetical protein
MTEPDRIAAIDAPTVAALARASGIEIPEERLDSVAERLREFHQLAAPLDGMDLESSAPDSTFEPAWPAHPQPASPGGTRS